MSDIGIQEPDYTQLSRRAASHKYGGTDPGLTAAMELARCNFRMTGIPQGVRGHDDGRYTVAPYVEGEFTGRDWYCLRVVESL